MFQRFSSLVTGKPFAAAASVVPDAPKEVVKSFSSKADLADYLGLDDHSISQFCKACEASEDKELRSLGAGLLNRQYFKAIDATDCRADTVTKFSLDASDFLKSKGYDGNLSSYSDTPGDTPYKMYDPDSEAPNTQIYVERRDGTQAEISTLSEPIAELRKKYALVRFYFPKDVRDDIEKIAQQTLRS
jgi:HD superfamily phosphohydrolase